MYIGDIMLDKISDSFNYISSNFKHVNINYEVIDKIVEEGSFDNLGCWLSSNPFGLMDMDLKDIINFLLIYHTVGDFCFWGEPKWEVKTDIGILDGSFAIMYLLLDKYKKKEDFNMSMLMFSTLLDGNVEIPLLKERHDFLVEMNHYLSRHDFYEEIKDINKDTELLNYILDYFTYFKDESIYDGERVYFYKRAQLLVSDILHVKELNGIEVDYSSLLGCADYKIPQVMNSFGMIEYSEELDNMINNKVEISKDSIYENEIRLNQIVTKLDDVISSLYVFHSSLLEIPPI